MKKLGIYMNLGKNFLLCIIFLATLAATGCSPDYPKCDNDDHCLNNDKGKAEGRLWCVNGVCQQCRADSDCSGEGMTCNAGICERIVGYCTGDGDCLAGQKCRNNLCSAECESNDECGDGSECKGGTCTKTVECTLKADCRGGLDCIGGKCVEANDQNCELQDISFDYNSSVLSSSVQQDLQQSASCIKGRDLTVRLEGHTDERGTEEYNLALGERRARSVKNYLEKMGVNPRSLSTLSYGEERPIVQCGQEGPESCHRKNRRVVFSVR